MKIIRWLKKINVLIYCLIKFKSLQLAFYLAFYQVSMNRIQFIKRAGKQIIFKKNGNKIYFKQLPNFIFSMNMAFDLLNADIVKVINATPDNFILEINGLSFKVTSLSNMAVLYEIFIQKIYAIDLNSENVVVVDIGMNVGVASHFFANMPYVKSVYGYEPFPKTFAEALYNSELNPKIKNKLIQHNVGVSNFNGERKISLFESGLLSASTSKMENTYGIIEGIEIEIQFIAAIDLLQNVISDNPNSALCLKIDCEGEEYAIFESIKDTNLLDNVICIIVEWHEKGMDSITKILRNKGFQFLHIKNESLNCGMIYAFKSSSQQPL